jgi:hypothetical protein
MPSHSTFLTLAFIAKAAKILSSNGTRAAENSHSMIENEATARASIEYESKTRFEVSNSCIENQKLEQAFNYEPPWQIAVKPIDLTTLSTESLPGDNFS